MSRHRLRDLLPRGPVLKTARRLKLFGDPPPAQIRYSTPPQIHSPPLALMPFGLAYDMDIVVVAEGSPWDMHELASVATPDGLMWIAKDARAPGLQQLITCDDGAIARWLPEVPISRFKNAMDVSCVQSSGDLSIQARWINPDGVETALTYAGPAPLRPRGKRNASTMGHSRDAVIAALDLSHMNWPRHVALRYDGRPARLARIAWLKPFAMAIRQVQGGLGTGPFVQRQTTTGLITEHLIGHEVVQQHWTTSAKGDRLEVRQSTPLRTITYLYRGEDVHELERIEIQQFNRPHPTMMLTFSPCLPDLRRRFSGRHCSRWVLDINGQLSHAVGTVEVDCVAGGVQLDISPRAPHWVADRPLRTALTFDGDDTINVISNRRV